MGFSSGRRGARHDIAQLWARWNETGEGPSDKTKGSVSFAGVRFYSYQTPVARYHTGVDGQKYVLVTSVQHSPTTSGHVSAALGAVDVPWFRVPWFRVPMIGMAHMPNRLDLLDHLDNARYLYDLLEKDAAKFVRSGHKCTVADGSWWQNCIENDWDKCQHYVNLTGVQFQLKPRRQMVNDIRMGIIEAARKWDENAPKRERAAAKRLALQVLTKN